MNQLVYFEYLVLFYSIFYSFRFYAPFKPCTPALSESQTSHFMVVADWLPSGRRNVGRHATLYLCIGMCACVLCRHLDLCVYACVKEIKSLSTLMCFFKNSCSVLLCTKTQAQSREHTNQHTVMRPNNSQSNCSNTYNIEHRIMAFSFFSVILNLREVVQNWAASAT